MPAILRWMSDDSGVPLDEPDFDFIGYSAGIPCDPELLEPLGRVSIAASRLLGRMRDVINQIDGAPSDAPFDLSLGQARKALRERVERRKQVEVTPSVRALDRWLRGPAAGAIQARNGVVHAISFTAEDGAQGLRTTSRYGGSRVLRENAMRVAGLLERANALMPDADWVDGEDRRVDGETPNLSR